MCVQNIVIVKHDDDWEKDTVNLKEFHFEDMADNYVFDLL